MHEYALENIHERLPTLEEVVRVVPLENSSVMLCAVCHRQLAPAFRFVRIAPREKWARICSLRGTYRSWRWEWSKNERCEDIRAQTQPAHLQREGNRRQVGGREG